MPLLQLPRGVTGLQRSDEPSLPVTDLRAFLTHCHAAARAVGGRAIPTKPSPGEAVANFTRALIELRGRSIAVLLNRHYPILAFAASSRAFEHEFVDCVLLAESFEALGVYRVLSASEADGPLTDDGCRLLAPVEVAAVRHWKPRRMGDIVFNLWD